MKRIYSACKDISFGICTLALLGVGFSASAADYKAKITGSSLPADMTAVNRDGGTPRSDVFSTKALPNLSGNWFAGLAPQDGNFISEGDMAMMSVSLREDSNKATDNWIITPQLNIKAGDVLRWTAKSIDFDHREKYTIYISTTGTNREDFKYLTQVFNEGYLWTKHYVDLNQYAGKNVYIALVHDSTNKFMLAVSNFEVGTPAEADIVAENLSTRFFGRDDNASVTVMLENHGADVMLSDLILESVNGDEASSIMASYKDFTGVTPGLLAHGDRISINLPVNMEVGDATEYKAVVVTADNKEITLFNDFINKSWFKRTVTVEKFTGTWCTNCPLVTYRTHLFLEKYGRDVIYIEDHMGNDVLAYDPYGKFPSTLEEYTIAGMTLYRSVFANAISNNLPAVWFNRRYALNSDVPSSMTHVSPTMLMDCNVGVELRDIKLDAAARTVSGKVVMRSSTPLENIGENNGDIYRLGITFVENALKAPQYANQRKQNDGGGAVYGEMGYVTANVPYDIIEYTNIVRGPENGSAGEPYSLPETIEAMNEYSYEFENVAVPETITNLDNMSIIGTMTQQIRASKQKDTFLQVLNADIYNFFDPVQYEYTLTLMPEKTDIKVGDEMQLYAYPNPDDITTPVFWHSSDNSVASITPAGLLTGMSTGEVVITAGLTDYNGNNVYTECRINVINDATGIDEVVMKNAVVRVVGNTVTVTMPESNACEATLYGLDGKVISKAYGASNLLTLDAGDADFVIIKVKQGNFAGTYKLHINR